MISVPGARRHSGRLLPCYGVLLQQQLYCCRREAVPPLDSHQRLVAEQRPEEGKDTLGRHDLLAFVVVARHYHLLLAIPELASRIGSGRAQRSGGAQEEPPP